MAMTEPVEDWATDYDIFDPGYVKDPFAVWEQLRGECPVAHSDRWGGSWLPLTYEGVAAIAHDTDHFSSDDVTVAPLPQDEDGDVDPVKAPPITSDPPEHLWARRLILPAFAPKAVREYEPYTKRLCGELIDAVIDSGAADAAADYAQQIPPRVIAHMLGVDPAMSDEFTTWVRGVLEIGLTDPESFKTYNEKILDFFFAEVADRQASPKDDFISWLLAQEVDGEPVPVNHVVGTCNLLLIAGIDTTWSSIGAALWHLGLAHDDRRRLVDEPELMPIAIEELLRAYAPVTMARIVTEEVDVGGRTFQPGDRVLLNFPGANRDPEMFSDADKVVIDRAENRHCAFGLGVHRCAGSNLARMEMQIALTEWLARIPDYEIADPESVTWAGGQVRGPRHLPVRF